MKPQEIQNLLSDVLGTKARYVDCEVSPRIRVDKLHQDHQHLIAEDKDDKCKCVGRECCAFKYRQDLPYFGDLNQIEDMVIAEAPGTGEEKGELGSVFGWFEYFSDKELGKSINHYYQYFFSLLGLIPEKTYITDAVKCYASSKDFKEAFSHCKTYLGREIRILNPNRIIVISKKEPLLDFLREEFPEKKIINLPHPSRQNMGKIKTVGEIFESLGKVTGNREWEELGLGIEREYKELKSKLG